MSGPLSPRGTGSTRMPSAASRAYSTDQPGSSTRTLSPARSSVRVTMSSACVAPIVVAIWAGEATTPKSAILAASASRRRSSPAGSPYCSATAAVRRLAVARRIAALSTEPSSHSAGSVPRPGIARPPGAWNMPRMSAVALFGSGRIGAGAALAREPASRGATRARGRRSHAAPSPRRAPAPAAGRRRRRRCRGSRHGGARTRAPTASARPARAAAARCARRSGARAARRASCRRRGRQCARRPCRFARRAGGSCRCSDRYSSARHAAKCIGTVLVAGLHSSARRHRHERFRDRDLRVRLPPRRAVSPTACSASRSSR